MTDRAGSEDEMETLREAIARLERSGFPAQLSARPGACLRGGGVTHPASEFAVEEVVRFEGRSDPQDEAVLFALRSLDGSVRGTFVASYGPQVDPDVVEVVERLEAAARQRRHHLGGS